jgi:hypothetical protein
VTCNCPSNTAGTKMHNIDCWRMEMVGPRDTFAPVCRPVLLLTLRFADGDEVTVGAPSPVTDDEIERVITALTRRFLQAVRADSRIRTL